MKRLEVSFNQFFFFMISLNLSACLSLPSLPLCYDSYDLINLKSLKKNDVFLCCENTAECEAKLSSAIQVQSEEERNEFMAIAKTYYCNEEFVCVLETMNNDEPTGGDDITSNICQTDADCGVGYQCEFNMCVIDVENDDDFDGVPNATDNCLMVPNSQQVDCDRNGLGDACDPAGPCGGELSGQTINFVEMRRTLPQACVFLELEGTNLRTRSNSQGSFSTEFLFNLGTKRLLGFVGGGKNDDETECVNFDQSHSSAYHSKPLFVEKVVIPERLGVDLIQDIFIIPRASLTGRVLRQGFPPNEPAHGGIKVRLIGSSREGTLTDQWGRFYLQNLEPDDQYTLILSSVGYEKQRIEGISLNENTNHVLDTKGVIPVYGNQESIGLSQSGLCQRSLYDTTCDPSDPNDCNNPCGGGGELPSSCSNGLICVPSQWGWGVQLAKNETSQEEKEQVTVSLRILSMPHHQEGNSHLQPEPILIIQPKFSGQTLQVELLPDDDLIIERDNLPPIIYHKFSWSGRLETTELYTMIIEAGDPNRILSARYLNLAIDAEQSEDTYQINFDLTPIRTFDATTNYDEDRDGIIDDEDPDQDGDGCLDSLDSNSRNPYLSLNKLDSCGYSPEWCTDDDDDGLSDLEELLSGLDGRQSSPIENEINLESMFTITAGQGSRINHLRAESSALVTSSPAYQWGKRKEMVVRFAVSPRMASDQDPLRIKFEAPFPLPLLEPVNERSYILEGQWSISLVQDNCPLQNSQIINQLDEFTIGERAQQTCLVRESLLSCASTEGLEYVLCNAEIEIDNSESFLLAETEFSLIVVENSISPSLENLAITPPCSSFCLADYALPQYLYALLRRAFATTESGSCLFEEGSPNDPLEVYLSRPSLLRELVVQCVPLSYDGEMITPENDIESCLVEPLIDELGQAYILTQVLESELPVACEPMMESMMKWGQEPIIVLSDECRTALRMEGGRLKLRLQNQRSEELIIDLPLAMGDQFGRCMF